MYISLDYSLRESRNETEASVMVYGLSPEQTPYRAQAQASIKLRASVKMRIHFSINLRWEGQLHDIQVVIL